MTGTWTRSSRGGAVAAAVTLALVACSPAEDSAPTPGVDATEAQDDDGPHPEIADSAVGRAAQWALDQLAADAGPDAAEAAERFAPVFLEQVPAGQVAAVFDQLRARGPYSVTTYTEHANNAQAELRDRQDERMLLSVSVDDAELIQGLFLQPLPEVPDITAPDDAAAAVTEAAEHAAFLLAEVEGSECVPVEAGGEPALLPIGSIFKLYVLGAVVRAIEAGELTWTDPLTLTEEMRSLPSGTLQEEPDGTEVTVQEAAEMMIAISDNTATDLLIDAVGRERVEQAMVDMGHARPEVNMPFVTTREMFQLALSDPALREEWAAASGEEPLSTDPAVSDRQRALLADLPPWDRTVDESLGGTPSWPVGLDWFATTEDLCAAHVALQELARSEAGAPVREILGANPGLVGQAPEGLDYVGFKGGSAVGEIAGAWYTETADGDRYALIIQLADDADPAGVPDPGWLFQVATQTLGAVAER